MTERVQDLLFNSFFEILAPGLTATIPLTVISFSLALGIAMVVALVRHARVPVLSVLTRFYTWFMRGTPLFVQLYVVFYGLPDFGVLIDPFPAAVIVFSLNTGAYASETLRAAIGAVLLGQIVASRSLGMGYLQVIRYIVLP